MMDPVFLRAVLVVAGLVVVVLAGLWLKRRDGNVRVSDGTEPTAAASAAPGASAPEANAAGPANGTDTDRLAPGDLDAVGLDLANADVGAVLFGSPTCAPCANVKQILGELTEERDRFRWVYADAGDHLDLTRQHRILRVPTVLMVGASGSVVARASGVPKIDDLRAVLDRQQPA